MIPGSIPLVISADVVGKSNGGWLASARVRHFGHYPLIEDDSVHSKGSTLLNLRGGREWGCYGVYLDLLYALNSRDHDVDYYSPRVCKASRPKASTLSTITCSSRARCD